MGELLFSFRQFTYMHRCAGNTYCAVCLGGGGFQTTHALDNHAKQATHQAYKCKCGTGFNKHSALKRHIDTKDESKTFACILCSDKFTRKDQLKDHCRHYHKIAVDCLRNLFDAQQSRPCGAALRRLQARSPAAASSGSAPNLATARPPVLPLLLLVRLCGRTRRPLSRTAPVPWQAHLSVLVRSPRPLGAHSSQHIQSIRLAHSSRLQTPSLPLLSWTRIFQARLMTSSGMEPGPWASTASAASAASAPEQSICFGAYCFLRV